MSLVQQVLSTTLCVLHVDRKGSDRGTWSEEEMQTTVSEHMTVCIQMMNNLSVMW